MSRDDADATSDVAARYWSERGGKPEPRPRHPLTPDEEHAYLVAGSRLFNERNYYDGHDEWEEVWRRATGDRRRLLHGLIQVAVGYEHLKRENPHGMRSLLRQGADKLHEFTDRAGIPAIRDRALADAEVASREIDDASRGGRAPVLSLEGVDPPTVMVAIEGHGADAPTGAIRIPVPPPEPDGDAP